MTHPIQRLSVRLWNTTVSWQVASNALKWLGCDDIDLLQQTLQVAKNQIENAHVNHKYFIDIQLVPLVSCFPVDIDTFFLNGGCVVLIIACQFHLTLSSSYLK